MGKSTVNRNAVPASEMVLKLRHAASNAKLDHTPYNLIQAAVCAYYEHADLVGESSAAYETVGAVLKGFYTEHSIGLDVELAELRRVGATPRDLMPLRLGVEVLLNMPLKHPDGTEVSATDRVTAILSEFRDMELM